MEDIIETAETNLVDVAETHSAATALITHLTVAVVSVLVASQVKRVYTKFVTARSEKKAEKASNED